MSEAVLLTAAYRGFRTKRATSKNGMHYRSRKKFRAAIVFDAQLTCVGQNSRPM